MNSKLTTNIVTCFSIGNIKYAPGSFGSLAAYPFITIVFLILLSISLFISKFGNFEFIFCGLLLSTILLFILGCKYSQIYVDTFNKEDPGEIVIDEIVGQSLMLILILPINRAIFYSQDFTNIILYFVLIPFILFRLFDIIKPWPISWFDNNVKGGFGIMLDDVIASLFATLIYYNIFYLFN